MTWFERCFGFVETDPQAVREKLVYHDGELVSSVNGARYHAGILTMPSLAELRRQVAAVSCKGHLRVREQVAESKALHADPRNAGALFQVASQFNLLEMASSDVTPEKGVAGYEYDYTQGPACAIAAGAGTVYRNYFIDIDGQTGQTHDRQVDCLHDLGVALGNEQGALWHMKNGYLKITESQLQTVVDHLRSCDEVERDRLRALLRIGIQQDTQVTLPGCTHRVTQAYCSALPLAYNNSPVAMWEPFARLVLEATYEATLCAAITNAQCSGNSTVYLTLIGGGAFGNPASWIMDAISRALWQHRQAALDVVIVSYRRPNPEVERLLCV